MIPPARMRLASALLLAGAVLLSACASLEDPTRDWSAERLYQEGKERIAEGDYETAIKHFEKIQARYPYGRHAEQAQLEIAYAYYKHNEPALAVAAADRFIRQYPTHPNVDYAYYLKGLTNFRGERGLVEWLISDAVDDVDRDPRATREALAAFRELLERFPNSRYAPDATQRIAYLTDGQARYEIMVARYYFERTAYVATVNRCKYTLQNYPRTPSVEDALGLQAMAYKKMGMNDLMIDTLRVLRANFPDSAYFGEVETLEVSDDDG
jgi:outer membrane protein assembly factor BamD